MSPLFNNIRIIWTSAGYIQFSRAGLFGHAVFDLTALKHDYFLIMTGVDDILDIKAVRFESLDPVCPQDTTRLLFAKYRRQVRA